MENQVVSVSGTYAGAAKRKTSVTGGPVNGGTREIGVNGKTFEVVVKSSDKCAKITSDEMKKKVMNEVNEFAKMHVRAEKHRNCN